MKMVAMNNTMNEIPIDSDLVDYARNRVSRRAFARNALFGSAAIAAAGAMSIDLGAQAITDTAILQFALNLEYLEAEFYTVITQGLTISQVGIGTSGLGTEGPTVGGGKLSLSEPVLSLALELAADEQAHVKLLRTALGAAAIAKPTIDFSVAGVRDEASFLTVSRILEDVGVTAYGGAAPLITDKAILGTAARILATEAEHTGAIRYYISQFTPIRPTAIDGNDIVNRIISANTTTGLTAVRTPSQVLALVFLNPAPGTTRGGVFPAGVNGPINAV
jgi:hypothetical protein